MASFPSTLSLMLVVACSSPTFEYSDGQDAGGSGAAAGVGGQSGSGGSLSGGAAGSGGSLSGGAAGIGGSSSGGGGNTGGATGGTGSSGGSGGTASCSVGQVCAAVAPAGWQGPWYVFRGPTSATPPTCPGTAKASLTANIGLQVAPGSCGCTCSGSPNCASSLKVSFSETSCSAGSCSDKTLSAGQCVQLDSGCSAFAAVEAAPTPGPCTPSAQSSIPPPTWQERVQACPAPVTAACGTGGCVAAPPAAFASGLCIGKAGDQACTAPGYSNKVLVHQGVTDTRSCAACFCSPQACGQITLYPNGCGSSVSKAVLPGTCGAGYAVGGGVSSAWARYSTVGGGCSANKPALTGSAVESGAFTLCCSE